MIDIFPVLPELSFLSLKDPQMSSNCENAVTPSVSPTISPRFTAFLRRAEETQPLIGSSKMIIRDEPTGIASVSEQPETTISNEETAGPSSCRQQDVVITRQEAFALNNVLGRILQAMIVNLRWKSPLTSILK